MWCFYDYFDTIVHRKCNPETTKMIWAQKMSEIFPQITPRFFWKIRIESEKYIERNSRYKNENSYSVLVDEVYSRIISLVPNCSSALFYDISLNADIDAELSVQYIDNDTLKIMKDKKKEGYNIAVISDFYLPSGAFFRFFEYHGLNKLIDKCYISSEYDARKSNGTLYDIVLSELNCSGNCSMYGDNKNSDYIIPMRKGIDAKLKSVNIDGFILPTLDNLEKELYKIEKETGSILFGRYAFYIYYFIENLARELENNKTTNVFFLAREGKPLKQVFDWYLEKKKITTIKTHYLCASRASTLLASRAELEAEKFTPFFREFRDVSLNDFLSSLGFRKDEIDIISNDIEIDSNMVIKHLSDSIEMKKLRKSIVFNKIYEDKRNLQKKSFVKYLDSFDSDYKENGLCLVDVGWKGSIQDNIFKILDEKIKVHGFYIGINGKTIVHKNNFKKGLVFSRFPFESPFYEYLSQQTFIIEQLLSADHGPTLSYKLVNDMVEPIIGEDKENDAIYKIVGNVQNSWYQIFEKIFQLFEYSIYTYSDMKKAIANIYLRTILCRTIREAKFKTVWSCTASNNFGSSTGNNIQRNFYQKLKYFIKSLRHTSGEKYFGIMNSLEILTKKMKCQWMNIFIERVFYLFIRRKMNGYERRKLSD